MGICHFKVFQFLFSGSEHLSNFGRGSPKRLFCEIILKLGHWPARICHLNIFLFFTLASILFSRAKPC